MNDLNMYDPAAASRAMEIKEHLTIAETLGWYFAVGKIAGDRWIGFAVGRPKSVRESIFVNFFSEVSDGVELGMLDRAKAIRLTSAIAQDESRAFGAINRWFIPEAERGTPDEFRCRTCGEVGCPGIDCDDGCYDTGEE